MVYEWNNEITGSERSLGNDKSRILELFWINILSKILFHSLCFILGGGIVSTPTFIIIDKNTGSCAPLYSRSHDLYNSESTLIKETFTQV